ncbi:MAG: O-antigen ligase family protein [Patescibacteria group bacterium]
MSKYLLVLILIFVVLYPKFPLLGVSGTFVAVRLEDFVVAAAVLFWAATAALRQKYLPVHRSILLYLAVGFVSVFSAIFVTKTAGLNLGLLHALRRVEYMALFAVGFHALQNKNQLHFLIRTFLLVSLLVSIFGLGQQFLGWPVISTTNSEFAKGLALTLGEGARINSTFAGHYDLAAFSIFPLLLVISLLTLPQIRHKWLLVSIGSLAYWTMLLSASRVTFAAFYVTTALFLLLIRKRLWLIPLVLLAIFSILASPQLLGRYRELFINHVRAAADEEVPDALKPPAVPEDRSFNIRLQAEWPRALRAFYQNPLLGTGFSSVGLAVDNDYLRVLAETGLFGLAAFGLIMIRIFKTSLPYFRAPSSPTDAFIIAVTLGLVSLLLNAVFIDVFEASKVAIIAWTLLGAAEKAKMLT